MVAEIPKGLVIDPVYERGQWRVRVAKADGSDVRSTEPGGRVAVSRDWLSSSYLTRDFAIEQVKDAIDRGELS
jgi:hypothetical protein